MARYRIIEGLHHHSDGKSYAKGQILEAPDEENLQERFPNKFQRVTSRAVSAEPPPPLNPAPVTKLPTDDVDEDEIDEITTGPDATKTATGPNGASAAAKATPITPAPNGADARFGTPNGPGVPADEDEEDLEPATPRAKHPADEDEDDDEDDDKDEDDATPAKKKAPGHKPAPKRPGRK